MHPFPFIPILMVSFGILWLLLALIPTAKLCRKENSYYLSWRFLLLCIVLFVFGYTFFLVFLLHSPPSKVNAILSIILLGGSLFVIIVVRLSVLSIEATKHQALHDRLTGLPNRTLLEDRLDHCLKVAQRNKQPIAFLILDLVRFKKINDLFGHFYGDYILQEVASRMKSVVRQSDTLARFGGDEFALLLCDADLEQAKQMSIRVAGVLDSSFKIEGKNLTVGVSIGIAMFPEHAFETDVLARMADEAMYEAKRNELIYAVYDPSFVSPDRKS